MATTKRLKRRTGEARVYDNAEVKTSFPSSKKVVRIYKLTAYADGRLVKTEVRKTTKKTAKKTARKGARRRKGGKKK